jgi:hypothetical protein
MNKYIEFENNKIEIEKIHFITVSIGTVVLPSKLIYENNDKGYKHYEPNIDEAEFDYQIAILHDKGHNYEYYKTEEEMKNKCSEIEFIIKKYHKEQKEKTEIFKNR